MDALALRVTAGQRAYQRGTTRQPVFTNLNLEVRTGEVLALLGPSGCGKSTLLRILAGLEPLDQGRIEVFGTRPYAPKVGIAFQQPSLLPWLTVAQNVALGLRFAANRSARTPDAVSRVLDELRLEPVADAYPAELSGGQAQRANVARLVVTGRPILLLDEPFAALDPGTREALQDWLLDLQRARGLTLVVVTHDLSEALHLGDRVAVMSGIPGTIRRVWDVRSHGGRTDRSEAGEAIRRHILSQYDADPPPGDPRPGDTLTTWVDALTDSPQGR